MKGIIHCFILVSVSLLLNYPQVYAGRCTGSSYCGACKNCSACKYCNEGGGTCGVCSVGGSSEEYSEPDYSTAPSSSDESMTTDDYQSDNYSSDSYSSDNYTTYEQPEQDTKSSGTGWGWWVLGILGFLILVFSGKK